jgi:hypothetical protein
MRLMAQESTKPRKGQAPPTLGREAFAERFAESFYDPAFGAVANELKRVEAIAWENYSKGRKAPRTEKAGPGFADAGYDLSIEWRATRDKLLAAEKKQKDAATPSRILVVCGSARNDGTCPGEISKTFRMAKLAEEIIA